MTQASLRLSPDAARVLRDEVARAGGREVSFLAEVTDARLIVNPRAVARGNRTAVLAVARDAPEGGVMIHNHPSGNLDPSDADLAVAARLFEQGLGSAIIPNEADRLYVLVEPPRPRVRVPIDLDALEAAVSPDGGLSVMAGYEDRAGQRQMLRFVAQHFNDGGIGIVEAGTGTGKSLAYLLPAARWSLQNRERTVVSTNTINLQEQLVGKDIGLVEDVLGEQVKWALLKGRGNYISIRRAYLAAESGKSLFEEDREEELQGYLDWIEKTQDGSLTDLPFEPTSDVWDEVRSETDACLRAKCPYFQECFYQKARRHAAAADLVIANHHLFFSDLSVRIATENYRDAAVLPAYGRVVFDEAHHLEDTATAHLGAQVNRIGLYRTVSRLDRGGKGILAAVDTVLKRSGAEEAVPLRSRLEERVRPRVEALRSELSLFFDHLEPWVEARSRGEALRIGHQDDFEPTTHPGVQERLSGLLQRLAELERELRTFRDRMESEDDLRPELEGRLLDVSGVERRLAAAQSALRLCLTPGDDAGRYVRWIETRRGRRGRRGNIAIAAAPVELGPLLREHLFSKAETVILTSATMATKDSFSYIKGRLGLGASGSVEGSRAPVPILGTPTNTSAHSAYGDTQPLEHGPIRGSDGVSDDEHPLLGTADYDVVQGDEDDAEIEVREVVVPSPFVYERQSTLVVPTDLPDPASPASEAGGFHDATARVIEDVATASGGGVFVLFTSYSALRAVGERIRENGIEGRWPLFLQGEGERSELLQRFVESGQGILLGTSSFWEGVDVPGRPLRALIIQKLPFRVPSEPITAARLEAIEARGASSFWEYMVPQAAIRLKQGVGRLIRSRKDRGVVVLLDDRILRKRYGRVLRDSLPPMPLTKGPWDEVITRIRQFYRDDDETGSPGACS